jgi:hypothetical protein
MSAPYAQPTADFQTSSLIGSLASGGSTSTIGTGLNIPSTNGLLQIDYDSTVAVGISNGPETISYASYNSGTGVLTGITRGLAGTTAVDHDNGASVQSGPSSLYFSDQASGWTSCLETWSYASATTITVPSNATTKYSVGDKIRLKQGGGYKYFYVTGVADTLLTVSGGSDYTVANSVITDNDFSKLSSPVGFPGYFETGLPTFTGIDDGSGGAPTKKASRFTMNGRMVQVFLSISGYKVTTDNQVLFINSPYPVTSSNMADGIIALGTGIVAGASSLDANFHFNATAGAWYWQFPSNISDNQAISSLSANFIYEAA